MTYRQTDRHTDRGYLIGPFPPGGPKGSNICYNYHDPCKQRGINPVIGKISAQRVQKKANITYIKNKKKSGCGHEIRCALG